MKIIELRNEMYKLNNIWYYIDLSKEYEVGHHNVKVKKDCLINNILFWQSLSSDSYTQHCDEDIAKVVRDKFAKSWEMA